MFVFYLRSWSCKMPVWRAAGGDIGFSGTFVGFRKRSPWYDIRVQQTRCVSRSQLKIRERCRRCGPNASVECRLHAVSGNHRSNALVRCRAFLRLESARYWTGSEPKLTLSSSLSPNNPSPQLTFVGPHASKAQLDEDIRNLSWMSIPHCLFAALWCGIGVHHAGMHKHYRTKIER